ncbi:MAG: bifunctional 5,10-methylenetetrahydrofolate dehydrogenase/5,10-methenyltetrahydrofolate cyclohydrolase, partial [Candidatus Levybacteria bacterium]|nr:bifunctional 5,10-methylenetetrahydrofolate dehydrogenase/5,10-methenyltetrahydrofolate cyclohydrolase [Candidatus Levybacteria bacterium]
MKIDGKAIAQDILQKLAQKTQDYKQKGIEPHLVIILVGDDPASAAYVRQKELKTSLVGIKTTILRLPAETEQQELLKRIGQFNNDKNVHGIIVQLPVPKHLDGKEIILAVKPEKDVDGFHANSPFLMPLGLAILEILKRVQHQTNEKNMDFKQWLKNQNIAVMGKGETGGKPVTQVLKLWEANPTVIDSKTVNPEELTKKADIIISAIGKPNMLKPKMINQNAILVSIGIHRGADGKLHGDYDEEKVKNIASFYTPTPGGVGPVNVAMLLE